MRALFRALYHSTRPLPFRNREGRADFDFALPGKRWRPGTSAMLRVKNEERRMEDCLGSIVDVFDEIVIVDNGSTDSTREVIARFVRSASAGEKIKLFSYPFGVARCGREHADTPEDSLHNLAYYYNWCLSRCTRALVFKWDADMVLLKGAAGQLRRWLAELPLLNGVVVSVPVQTVYRTPDGSFYAAAGEVNCEPRVFTNMAAVRFQKGSHWEVLKAHTKVGKIQWADVMIFEVKDSEVDEFAHWSSTDFPTERKQREWTNFNRIRSARFEEGDDFRKVDLTYPR